MENLKATPSEAVGHRADVRLTRTGPVLPFRVPAWVAVLFMFSVVAVAAVAATVVVVS